MISVTGLTVSYGSSTVVRDVSFTVAPGETYGLVGESGSGKSTVAAALTASLPPSASVSATTLDVDGQSVLSLRRAALRRFRGSSVGVVHQEPGLALDPTMPVGAQVAEMYPRRSSAVAGAFERVGLPTSLRRRFPHELSGGQQQRVVIAIALARSPRLLILDEPTTGLDARVETEIMALIDSLRRESGFATLLISHNLPLVAAHCDRIGVLQRGELVEEGPAAAVLASPDHPYTRRLVDALPSLDPGTPRAAASAVPPLVSVRGLTKRFGGTTALAGVDLTIAPGEVLGVVGGSGSGKSTLGRALAGLISYEGSITPVPRVQMVFQNPDASLNPRRTVRQVFTRSIQLLGGSWTASSLAAAVGLDESLLDRRPHQLSGGQKQRVSIGRAFAGPVPLVVLDEPTSALDVPVQALILDLLRDLQARTGVAYVFISHDLAVVRQLADRVAVLHEGVLVDLAEDLFADAKDPYTRSLIDSALALRGARPGG